MLLKSPIANPQKHADSPSCPDAEQGQTTGGQTRAKEWRGLALQRPDASGLPLSERHAYCTRSMGGSRNAVSVWAGTARNQKDAQAQRNRSLGNHAENGWVETVSAEVVTLGC